MANNHTLFSSKVEAPPEALEFLEKCIKTGEGLPPSEDFDESEACACHQMPAEGNDPAYLWVFSEDSGNINQLVAAVCAMQTKFNLTDPWGMEYAFTCDKPRIGEFAGGAVVCHKGESSWTSTGEWLSERMLTCRRMNPDYVEREPGDELGEQGDGLAGGADDR